MKFSELYVGQKASIKKTFTVADVTMFAGISLDVNPLHVSDEYAKNSLFKQRIVHGVLVCGLISAGLANKLPGEGTIYLGQEVKFERPVYFNDNITAELEVIELREDKKIAKIQTNCFKEDGTRVISGVATVKLEQ